MRQSLMGVGIYRFACGACIAQPLEGYAMSWQDHVRPKALLHLEKTMQHKLGGPSLLPDDACLMMLV